MIIETIHIDTFGGLRNADFELTDGVNVFAGDNESGKSSTAMFLKFIFYGLTTRASRSQGPSERQRWINRETGQAAGYMIVRTDDGNRYRLERSLTVSDGTPARERVRIIEETTGSTVTGQNPGEFFFGMPEDVFVDTCFVSQYRAVKPDIMGGASRGAVENLLTSANENIDVRRAVKKLETGRRELLTRSGGEITGLKERRDALETERNSAAERSEEILSVSASLDDIKKRIAQLEEDQDRYARVFRALDSIIVKRRIDAAAEARSRRSGLSRAAEKLDSTPAVGGASEEELLEAERDIHAYDEQYAAVEGQFVTAAAEAEKDFSLNENDLPDPADAVEEVRSLASASRIQFISTIASLIGGALGFIAAFVMRTLNVDVYFIPLVVGAVLLALGVTFLVLYGKTHGRLNRQLNLWKAESAEEIEVAVQERLAVLDRERALSRERTRLETSLTAAKAKRDAAEGQVRAIADEASVEQTEDIRELLTLLHRKVEQKKSERAALQASIGKLDGKLSVLDEQLEGVDEEAAAADARAILETEVGKYADSLTRDDVKQITKEREFTESALKSALSRRTNLEEKLAELGKLTRTPDELTTEILGLDERIDELTKRYEAFELAKEALVSAGEAMRSGVLPRLAEHAAALIREAAGTYDGIALDDSFVCSLKKGDAVTPQEILSRGTSDLSYLALRVALTGELFRDEQPPMVLDETFAHVDRHRTVAFMKQLRDRQYLIFTCRDEEVDAAEETGSSVTNLESNKQN